MACKTSNCYISGEEWTGSGCEAQLAEAFLRKLGFLKHNILMVANNPQNGKRVLTKEMALSGMSWLIDGAKNGDHLVFYFSNFSNFTEADLAVAVHEVLIDNLPFGTVLHIIGDGALSGSIVDLPHRCNWSSLKRGVAWKGLQRFSTKMLNGIQKGHSKGTIIQFSPIDELDEYSAKMELEEDDHRRLSLPGALTICFLYAIETGGLKLQYSLLIELMLEASRKLQDGLKDVLLHVSESPKPSRRSSSISPIWNRAILVGELVVQFGVNFSSDIVMTVAYRGVSFKEVLLLPRALAALGNWKAGCTLPDVSSNIHLNMSKKVLA